MSWATHVCPGTSRSGCRAASLALADGQLRLVRVDGSGREVIVLVASEDPGFVECAVTLDPESCVVYRVEEGAHP